MIALILVTLLATDWSVLVWLVWVCRNEGAAPEGTEDKSGFHFIP